MLTNVEKLGECMITFIKTEIQNSFLVKNFHSKTTARLSYINFNTISVTRKCSLKHFLIKRNDNPLFLKIFVPQI